MDTNTNNYNRLLKIIEKFPTFCNSFFLNSSLSVNSRIFYAHDLLQFFEYLRKYNSHFDKKTIKDIDIYDFEYVTTEQIDDFLLSFTSIDKNIVNKNNVNTTTTTAARKRTCLLSFFSYICSNTSLSTNPVDDSIKITVTSNNEVKTLTIEEQNKLLNCIKTGNGLSEKQLFYHQKNKYRDYALFILILDTGLRISEIYNSNIFDVNLNESYINVHRNNQWEKIYFSDSVCAALDEYFDFRETETGLVVPFSPLFITKKEKRLSIRQIEETLKKYLKVCLPHKYTEISIKDLRSSFAVNTLRINPDSLYVKKNLGLQTSESITKYAATIATEFHKNRNLLQNERNKAENK